VHGSEGLPRALELRGFHDGDDEPHGGVLRQEGFATLDRGAKA
jgi:hypothetical protein